MTGPRNRAAFEIGQRKREAIREILAAHSPLLPALTLEQLQERLIERGFYLAKSSIAYHRAAIWEEEAIREIDGCGSNSNPNDEAA